MNLYLHIYNNSKYGCAKNNVYNNSLQQEQIISFVQWKLCQ